MTTNGIILLENRATRTQLIEHSAKFEKLIPRTWGSEIYDGIPVKSLTDYNHLLTSRDFWKQVPFENVLIYQMDAELLNHGIEQYLKWHYVGAPWKFQEHGGNGGFSLRNRECMLKIIDEKPYRGEHLEGYEDVYFSNHMHDGKGYFGRLAPREVCKTFSCESIFEMGTLGAHAIDKYLTEQQCERIRNQYK